MIRQTEELFKGLLFEENSFILFRFIFLLNLFFNPSSPLPPTSHIYQVLNWKAERKPEKYSGKTVSFLSSIIGKINELCANPVLKYFVGKENKMDDNFGLTKSTLAPKKVFGIPLESKIKV